MERIEADWLKADRTQVVFDLLSDGGYQAFAVGGCVRNALLGVPVKDIDIATDALPETVMELAEKARLKAVPTGIEYGTVTVLSEGEPFEVTTFRRDVETDGRRAVVAFSDKIDEDARRRDFTMNALYADADGTVHDPLGGIEDLRARRVRFIEDATTRIREDYLRSLRFFRFHAWYGDEAGGLDPEALDAIAANLDGLSQLSRERIGSEVKRLLQSDDPTRAVAGMRATGVLNAILPGADDTALGPLIHLEREAAVAPDALRRLAVLGGEDVVDQLRLSRKEADDLQAMASGAAFAPAALGYWLGEETGRDSYLVTAASLGQPLNPADLKAIRAGAEAEFPVSAADLMPELSGPALGQALAKLEADWIASNFELSKSALLDNLKG